MIKNYLKNLFLKNESINNSGLEKVYDVLKYADKYDLYPDLKIIESAIEPEIKIDGKTYLMFTSNNYLGLSTHPKVKEATIKAIEKYGVGSTGSRLLSGNIDIFLQLEKKLAEFKGGEDAIVFPTGFSTNIGIISAVMNPLKVTASSFFTRKGIVLSDELNHASIIDGIKLSKQEKIVYKHCNINHLESLLKKYKHRRKLIVTDSVFSMDGDIAPLDKISELAKKYNTMTMIDEAHGVGVLGKNGGGVMEHFNLKTPDDITIVMGTLSKAIGSSGDYVVGSKELVRYLRVGARSYMFSTAMLPAAAAAAITVIDIIKNEPNLRKKLWENIDYLRNGLEKCGFNLMNSKSAINPILIGEDKKAIKMARMFFEENIFAPCVRWPAVARDTARIRFTITASHKKEQIDKLFKVCEKIGKELGII